MEERLQKIIARAGVASRRAAEEMIVRGRVTVNGVVTSSLGVKADPEIDEIRVDGNRLWRWFDDPEGEAHRSLDDAR